MRRFHGLLDAPYLVRWAHFCVTFVDHFAEVPWRLLSLPSAEAALAALEAAQETASLGELEALLAGRLAPQTGGWLRERSVGLEPGVRTE